MIEWNKKHELIYDSLDAPFVIVVLRNKDLIELKEKGFKYIASAKTEYSKRAILTYCEKTNKRLLLVKCHTSKSRLYAGNFNVKISLFEYDKSLNEVETSIKTEVASIIKHYKIEKVVSERSFEDDDIQI